MTHFIEKAEVILESILQIFFCGLTELLSMRSVSKATGLDQTLEIFSFRTPISHYYSLSPKFHNSYSNNQKKTSSFLLGRKRRIWS